jgi:hypothetical protein
MHLPRTTQVRWLLAHVALLAAAGCSSSGAAAPDAGAGADAGEAGPVFGCGGCNCPTPAVTMGEATPSQACQLAAPYPVSYMVCDTFCAALNHGSSGYFCTLAPDYVAAYQAAQPDGGAGDGDAGYGGATDGGAADGGVVDGGAADGGASDGGVSGADAGPACPAWTGNVVVQCGIQCTGRRTDAVLPGAAGELGSLGAVFAERAHLEEVSVHAFARLEAELRAHGAPPSLLRDVRRARRDEVRHTAMMTRLARRFGGGPRRPIALAPREVRPLLAIAIENAVEGCVRETYGAAAGLIEARGSCDPEVRRAMTSIAADECRHAELSWDVARWMAPRLTAGGRRAVARAMGDAVAALGRDADAGVVRLLSDHLWRDALAAA